MSTGNYSVYEFDTVERQCGQLVSGCDNLFIENADKVARKIAAKRAENNNTSWKRVPAGENQVFQIEGQRMGFIVMKNNAGTDYETALQSQAKASAQ